MTGPAPGQDAARTSHPSLSREPPRHPIHRHCSLHQSLANRCIHDLESVIRHHEDRDILYVVHMPRPMQIDEVDATVLGIVNDVVDVKVAVDVHRERRF